ncbi:MAG: hypothetical protein ACXVA4_06340, partial [Ktedonobacterales bacterium]
QNTLNIQTWYGGAFSRISWKNERRRIPLIASGIECGYFALAQKLAAARGRMIYCAVWGASDRWM